MKKIYFLIVLFIFFTSCKNNSKENSLANIDNVNKLTMTYMNEKCGEWGGDQEIITVYRDRPGGDLYLDYSFVIRNCKNPYTDNKIVKKKTIKVDKEIQKSIIEAINELTFNKLDRKNTPCNAGLKCTMIMNDSSIIINDFPAERWTSFEKLSEILNE